MQRGYSPARGRGNGFQQPAARGRDYQSSPSSRGGGRGTFVQVQPQQQSRSGGGSNPYVKDLYYDENGLCSNCHQGELTERYSAKYFNYNYQVGFKRKCSSYSVFVFAFLKAFLLNNRLPLKKNSVFLNRKKHCILTLFFLSAKPASATGVFTISQRRTFSRQPRPSQRLLPPTPREGSRDPCQRPRHQKKRKRKKTTMRCSRPK